ncbi:type I-B CRISPR-associated protein Cas7/Csh2 [Natronocalculus amylovorans]|uniref:Type I-B CRISPR-associated protein Cas7/Csh2 n=1 Tax=Natronocalculus amylovorans TaxID=2917812 RepID=A0AAE3G0J5_9EURY|nr:type I-B CRISPR-associated protein Cas7/Csh2 [Natronocalculus amylovorans]MCL9818358.1 type I-B CRISPR-associated protein Cas7/Csh2 [Natronocalculus amylovorans]
MSDNHNTVKTRSEIVFITDAQDCNPNGNPLGENRPRIDPVTRQAAVTDVRLKRYLRDQLVSDEHGVFVKKTDEGTSGGRAKLALDVLGDIETKEDLEKVDDIEAEFLANATDVRYFGATLSFNKNPDNDLHKVIKEKFNSGNYTGPVQFSPARSLNAVELNEETNTLTSVISTNDEKKVGGFNLDDHRIKYGIFPFHGLVDEHGAKDTGLTHTDVERLDTLCWRALKNQTISRSKVGQEPRLYVRVEYNQPGYHIGDLQNGLKLDRELASDRNESMSDDAIRNVTDICLDVTGLVDRIANAADRIETVHIVGSDYLSVSYDGEQVGVASDVSRLIEESGVAVHNIEVYDEFESSLPSE